jgi:putative glutamine amidotransferase
MRLLSILLLSLLLYSSCKEEAKKEEPLKIAVSKSVPLKSYQHYIKWLKYGNPDVVTYDMYELGVDSALKVLAVCDGLLLTGGEDIDHHRYGMSDSNNLCEIHNFRRDSIEFALIERAFEKEMPIMGICRGHQLMNVYFGGSLIFDIPTEIGTNTIHRCAKSDTCRHEVRLVKEKLLSKITEVKSGLTNSSHHQGVRNLAPSLVANAYTEDGLIESVSLMNEKYPFLLGVQWHPERLDYEKNPLSGKISKHFLKAVQEYNKSSLK